MSEKLAATLILSAISGHQLTSKEKLFLKKRSVSGITLFNKPGQRNIPGEWSELQKLTSSLQNKNLPLLIAIDQEGGRVARMKQPFPDLGPPLLWREKINSEKFNEIIFNYGLEQGLLLKSLGINVNFAPVLDILQNENNPSIGDRAFGRTKEDVIKNVTPYIHGLQKSNIGFSLKHFPGQGDARTDTHLGSAIVDKSEEEILNEDVAPFQFFSRSAPMIMMSHAIYPKIDKNPASISSFWMEKFLRKKLKYRGLILSDDFNMKAIAQDDTSWKDSVVQAIAAGCDLILVCEHLEKSHLAIDAIKREMKKSKAFTTRVKTSTERILRYRKSLYEANPKQK